MTDETQVEEPVVEAAEAVEAPAADEPRSVIVDDVKFVVEELPEGIQNAIAQYDLWIVDHRVAQRRVTQIASGVQHLAGQIANAIREHVAAEEAAEAGEGVPTPGDLAPETAEAEASLDIPADDGEE